MSNQSNSTSWIITADWHIWDYADYNFSEKFRLNQFISLANRFVELSRLLNSKTLVIAGDFIDAPIMPPTTQHVVKKCIDILKSEFDTIYYILGQHDLATKAKNQDKVQTIVSLFEDSKFQYMHHKQIEVYGCKIGFQNWTKDQDTSWIEGHLDFLIGHYTKSTMFGQDIDDSKFDWMIHGDIHNDQEIGKFISIGNPIQKDMSSLSDGSFIYFDPKRKLFKRYRVDEDHTRFLRINYTLDQSEEGFQGPLQYNIFTPKSKDNSNAYKIEVPEWSEVSELIDKCVAQENLTDIHEVCLTKCLPFRDIDFNFQLKSMSIHGFRSIVDFSIDFEGNDRILMLGENGSGKSSIIEGLFNVFEKNRYLSVNQSDFTDDMSLEVTLFYQNKLYTIRRGSNWGLVIDGVEQGYNKKSDFESDVLDKLPFLQYTDLFFIHSSTQNLSSQFAQDRRIELISKFFKFGKIDALSDTAALEYDDVNEKIYNLETKLNNLDQVIVYLNQAINKENEELKDFDYEETLQTLEDLNKLKEKNQIYKQWLDSCKEVEFKYKTISEQLKDKELYISFDYKSGELQCEELRKEIDKTKQDQSKLNSDWNRWVELKRLINELTEQGFRAKDDYNKAYFGTCPTCGGKITGPEHDKLVKEYGDRLIVARQTYENYSEEFNKLSHFKEDGTIDELYYKNQSEKLIKRLSNLENELSDLNSKTLLSKKSHQEIESVKKKLEEIEKEQSSILSLNIEKVDLPLDYDFKLEKLMSIKFKFQTHFNTIKELENKELEKTKLKEELTPLKYNLNRLDKYYNLMSRTGLVYRSLLIKLAESFSGEKFKYEVNYGTSRGKDWISFDTYYKVRKNFRIYESLSDGQKNLSDLDFLSKLFSFRVGLLVMDEYTKHLDGDKQLIASEILDKINVNTLIITTHGANYPNATRKIYLSLDENEVTNSEVL